MKHIPDDEDNAEYEGPSKSALKRESERMQVLGERLMALKEFHWDRVPLSDAARAALDESLRISSHEGMRRHRQYVGKLMRNEDTESISAYLNKLEDHRELNTRAFHELEDMREQLITGGNEAIGAVLARYPHADSPKLRQLVRNARREREQVDADGKHGSEHGRKLFRYIRSLEEGEQD